MVYVITWSMILLASASSVCALLWAVQSGQFDRIDKGARSIFDESEADEPDCFPDLERRRPPLRQR